MLRSIVNGSLALFTVNLHIGKIFRLHLKPGGVLRLKWFPKMKRCMWGTRRVGTGCKIVNLRLVYRWIRRFHSRYHINLTKFPNISRLYHIYIFKPGKKSARFII
jgi:hypothetical protein